MFFKKEKRDKLWDNIKYSIIQVTIRRKREKIGQKKRFNDIISENFPKFKDLEAQRTPVRIR